MSLHSHPQVIDEAKRRLTMLFGELKGDLQANLEDDVQANLKGALGHHQAELNTNQAEPNTNQAEPNTNQAELDNRPRKRASFKRGVLAEAFGSEFGFQAGVLVSRSTTGEPPALPDDGPPTPAGFRV